MFSWATSFLFWINIFLIFLFRYREIIITIPLNIFSNKKLFAIPYILSGYAEISHNAQFNQTIYSKSYTNPSPNLNYSANALNISQYEAYKRFVNDKSIRLIGTGRDVYRVNNLSAIWVELYPKYNLQ